MGKASALPIFYVLRSRKPVCFCGCIFHVGGALFANQDFEHFKDIAEEGDDAGEKVLLDCVIAVSNDLALRVAVVRGHREYGVSAAGFHHQVLRIGFITGDGEALLVADRIQKRMQTFFRT